MKHVGYVRKSGALQILYIPVIAVSLLIIKVNKGAMEQMDRWQAIRLPQTRIPPTKPSRITATYVSEDCLVCWLNTRMNICIMQ
jgi:hypothetical protein